MFERSGRSSRPQRAQPRYTSCEREGTERGETEGETEECVRVRSRDGNVTEDTRTSVKRYTPTHTQSHKIRRTNTHRPDVVVLSNAAMVTASASAAACVAKGNEIDERENGSLAATQLKHTARDKHTFARQNQVLSVTRCACLSLTRALIHTPHQTSARAARTRPS